MLLCLVHHHTAGPSGGTAISNTPEEAHLAEQVAVLEALTEECATKETDFATSGLEFARFRDAYTRRFASLYAELDRLEAEIARLLAAMDPSPPSQQRAEEAAHRATDSDRLLTEAHQEAPAAPTADLRKLFHRVALAVHPDLTVEQDERDRRTKLMAAANAAYSKGDATELQRILDHEASRPEEVKGEGIAANLVRTIRKIAQVRARMKEIADLERALTADPVWKLWQRVNAASAKGQDLLANAEADLRARTASARAQLAAIGMQREESEARRT